MTILLRSMYSISDRKEMFSFHRPGPLGFSVTPKLRVIIEWSVLYPGKISELVTLPYTPRLMRKKACRQDMSGLRLLHVYLVTSGFSSRQISPRSRLIWTFLISASAFGWEVLARPPYLSNSEFKISAHDNVVAIKFKHSVFDILKKTRVVFARSIEIDQRERQVGHSNIHDNKTGSWVYVLFI